MIVPVTQVESSGSEISGRRVGFGWLDVPTEGNKGDAIEEEREGTAVVVEEVTGAWVRLVGLVLALVEDPALEELEPLLGELEVPRKGAEPEHL